MASSSANAPTTVIPVEVEPSSYNQDDHRRSSVNTTEKRDGKPNRSVTLPTDSEAETDLADGTYPPQRPSRRGTRESQADGTTPSLRRRMTELLVPEKPVGKEPTWGQSAKAIVFASWLNLLLVFIPVSRLRLRQVSEPGLITDNRARLQVGWALHFAIDNDTVIFVTT
jgi:Ca2+:H+ antiporter